MNGDIAIRFILGSAVITLTAVEVYYLVRIGRTSRVGVETVGENKVSVRLPAALIDLGLLMTVLYIIWPQWLAWSGSVLPLGLRWAGTGLALVGLLLRIWAHRALGSNYGWYMRVQGTQQLVTHGPYRRVRHPMYTASVLLTVGISLATANWLISAFLILPAVVTLAWRLDREEAMLLEKFGEKYRVYQERTGRLLPRW